MLCSAFGFYSVLDVMRQLSYWQTYNVMLSLWQEVFYFQIKVSHKPIYCGQRNR